MSLDGGSSIGRQRTHSEHGHVMSSRWTSLVPHTSVLAADSVNALVSLQYFPSTAQVTKYVRSV